MRILLATPDRVSRRLLKVTLANWGYEVVDVSDGEEAWAALQAEDGPRLAILERTMPGMGGVEVCRKVRQQPDVPYVYCLLLTAKDRKEDVVVALEAGVDDFVAKPFDADELQARLRTARRILELEEALRLQATYDVLTGALNRIVILDLLQRELRRGNREGKPIVVAMADLDHFKAVNDTYGHVAGDAVLRETVRRMHASMRAYDGIGRYGGEEFLIVLPGCNGQGGLALAERIRQRVAAEAVEVPRGTIRVTVSLGVTWRGEGAATGDDLIRAADAALYRAKGAGRNRVEIATAADVEGACHGQPAPTGRARVLWSALPASGVVSPSGVPPPASGSP